MVYQLDNDLWFPDPRDGEPDGLFAVGGDLSVDRLLLAYSNGIFPWYDHKEEPILWWCPMDRFVIFPKEIHISHSMRQMIRSGRYNLTVNMAFDRVIEHCSISNGRNKMKGAWLAGKMIDAYKELHRQHFAISVEVWDSKVKTANETGEARASYSDNPDYSEEYGLLIGGLYGVNIGKNFFGESMFSDAPSGSKLALIGLAQFLEGFDGIIDCQFETPHLLSMGGRHITYDEYMTYLKE